MFTTQIIELIQDGRHHQTELNPAVVVPESHPPTAMIEVKRFEQTDAEILFVYSLFISSVDK